MRDSKILNWVRSSDLFAVPVVLTYKGQKAFNTLVGGFFSLLLTTAFLTYAGIELYTDIKYPNQVSTVAPAWFSYQDNTIAYEMGTSNSTLAV